MNTLTKTMLATLAASLVAGSLALADDESLQRIDHPNGPPTFVYVPNYTGPVSVGVYNDGRTVDAYAYQQGPAHRHSVFNDQGARRVHRARAEEIEMSR